jgi:hypothetical protein
MDFTLTIVTVIVIVALNIFFDLSICKITLNFMICHV